MPFSQARRRWFETHILRRKAAPDELTEDEQLEMVKAQATTLAQRLSRKANGLATELKQIVIVALAKVETGLATHPEQALEELKELEALLKHRYSEDEMAVIQQINDIRSKASEHMKVVIRAAKTFTSQLLTLDAAVQNEVESFTPVDMDFWNDLHSAPLTEQRLEEELHFIKGIRNHYQECLNKLEQHRQALDPLRDALFIVPTRLKRYHEARRELQTLPEALDNPHLKKLIAFEQLNLDFAFRRSEAGKVLHPDLTVLRPWRTLLAPVLEKESLLGTRIREELERLKSSTQEVDLEKRHADLDILGEDEEDLLPDAQGQGTPLNPVPKNRLRLLEKQREVSAFAAAACDAVSEQARMFQRTAPTPVDLSQALRFDPAALTKPQADGRENVPERLVRHRLERRLKVMLEKLDERAQRDMALDYVLQGPERLRQRLIEAQGWNAASLSEGQQVWLTQATKLIHTAFQNFHAGKLSADNQQLTFKGTDNQAPRVYTKGQRLGKGGFGEVFLYASEDEHHPPIALKVMNAKSAQGEDEEEPASVVIEREIRCHHHLMRGPKDHPGRPYIVELLGVVQDAEGNLNMAMELMGGGDFRNNRIGMELASQANLIAQPVLELLRAHQLKQIIQGMTYLRDLGVAHHDLKPENFFMTADGILKIGDFGGGSMQLDDTQERTYAKGTTPGYTVQSIELDGSNENTDLFALGRILDVIEHQSTSPSEATVSSTSSGSLHPLMKALTELYSVHRPSLEQVLEAPFFAQVDGVDPAELAELQQHSVRYGQALAAYVRTNKEELISQLAPLLRPESRKLLVEGELSYLSAIKRELHFFTQSLETIKQFKGALSNQPEESQAQFFKQEIRKKELASLRKPLLALLGQAEEEQSGQEQNNNQAGNGAENNNPLEHNPGDEANPAEQQPPPKVGKAELAYLRLDALIKDKPLEALDKLQKDIFDKHAKLAVLRSNLLKAEDVVKVGQSLKEVSDRIRQSSLTA